MCIRCGSPRAKKRLSPAWWRPTGASATASASGSMPPRRGTWRSGPRAYARSGRPMRASSIIRGSVPGSQKRKSSGKSRPPLPRFAGQLSEEDAMAKMVSFNRPDGKSVNGYLAEPDIRGNAAAKAPGIVVIQEWWGLNDQIKSVADKLAKSGYRALVPDLYRGKVALEANEAQHLMQGLNFGDAAGQDIRGAVQYLKQSSPKVGVTGFCMGGALTVLSAVNVPEADAAVIWYGYPPLEYVDAKKIKAPLLGHWATQDQAFAISGVDALEKKLKEANVKFEFHRYKAKHAFANETANEKKLAMLEYNREAAELAWKRTMDFLARHLKA